MADVVWLVTWYDERGKKQRKKYLSGNSVGAFLVRTPALKVEVQVGTVQWGEPNELCGPPSS